MKLSRTTDVRTIAILQYMFSFALPSVRVARRTEKFILMNWQDMHLGLVKFFLSFLAFS